MLLNDSSKSSQVSSIDNASLVTYFMLFMGAATAGPILYRIKTSWLEILTDHSIKAQ